MYPGRRPVLTSFPKISAIFLLLLVSSVPVARNWSYALYVKTHVVLVISSLVGLIWHVLWQGLFEKATAFLAATVWVLSVLARIIIYVRVRWKLIATAGQSFTVHGGTHVEVNLQAPIRPFPGMYFYLYFAGLPLRYKFHGFPMVSCFWDASHDQTVTTRLHFLIQDDHPLPSSSPSRGVGKLTLEGPYGANLRLHTYETVVLLAESIGIAGVLPYALDLVQRRQYDELLKDKKIPASFRDVTRKVDLMWKLGSDDEDSWCDEQLKTLMALDGSKVCGCHGFRAPTLTAQTLVSGRLFYPSHCPVLQIPDKAAKFWKSRFDCDESQVNDHIDHCIKWYSNFCSGRSVVVGMYVPVHERQLSDRRKFAGHNRSEGVFARL